MSRLVAWIAGVLGVFVIAAVDYFSGTELRVLPLYFAPVSLVAWHAGRGGALALAALSAASWVVSNYLAGLTFSHPVLWIGNTLLQGASFVVVGLLIATLRAALVRERGLSRLDPLTSLLNTRAFYEECEILLALCRRKQRPVTIAYIDLDNFKHINDSLGHQAGDDLLRRVATVLRASMRPSDLIARLGGDEFGILLPEAGPEQATATLERIHSLLANRFASVGPGVTCSIGAVTFRTVPDDVEGMVHQADIRMYAAKHQGRNRLHLDLLEMQPPSPSR